MIPATYDEEHRKADVRDKKEFVCQMAEEMACLKEDEHASYGGNLDAVSSCKPHRRHNSLPLPISDMAQDKPYSKLRRHRRLASWTSILVL